MKKFSVNCDFSGQIAPFSVYIGVPEGSHHPLHFQADWLGKNRGGSIVPEVMESIGRLKELADKNGIPLEDLCVYALGAAQQEIDEEQNPQNLSESTSLEASDTDDEDFEDMVFSPEENGNSSTIENLALSNISEEDDDDSYLDDLFEDDIDFENNDNKKE